MKTKTVSIIILLLVLCIAFFISGCSGNETTGKAGADNTLQKMKDRGTLMIGTYSQLKPSTFKDADGNIVGYDIDVARLIAENMDIDLEIKEMQFMELFDAVEKKEIDFAISGITITNERSEKYLFSVPYFDTGQVIIAKKDSGIDSFNDIEGKTVCTFEGTTGEETAIRLKESVFFNHVSYKTIDGMFNALLNNDCDINIEDFVVAKMRTKDYPPIKIVGNFLTEEYYGIMTNYENNALMEEINKILRELKRDEKIDELLTKWIE